MGVTGYVTAAALAALAACAGPVEIDAETLAGRWGGPHVELTFDSAGSAVAEYDCAHGTLAAPITDLGDGRFTATGVHVIEHGGPVIDGEPPDAHPAIYAGRLRGDRLQLTVTLQDGSRQEIGPFELVRGAPGMLFRCL